MKARIRNRINEICEKQRVSNSSQERLMGRRTAASILKRHKIPIPALRKRLEEYATSSSSSLQRDAALDVLGNRCVCCGDANPRVLDIDHIYEDGKQHRTKVANTIRWVVTNPEEAITRVQLLCANCHAEKTRYGKCHHTTPEAKGETA